VLEQPEGCGNQTPSARKLFLRANLIYVPNIKMKRKPKSRSVHNFGTCVWRTDAHLATCVKKIVFQCRKNRILSSASLSPQCHTACPPSFNWSENYVLCHCQTCRDIVWPAPLNSGFSHVCENLKQCPTPATSAMHRLAKHLHPQARPLTLMNNLFSQYENNLLVNMQFKATYTYTVRYPIWDCGLTKNCGHVRDMVDF